MDKRELLQICVGEETDAVGFWDQTVSKQQDENLRYYYGEPFGDERPGFSQVVSQDVAEVIDGRMPDLIKIFVSGDRIVEYEPTGAEDEAFADQATDYANYIFWKDNDGFTLLHNWFKDALISKVGVVKVWWDEDKTVHPAETLTGLSVLAVAEMLNDPAIEILEQEMEPTEDLMSYPDGIIYTLKIKRTETKGRVRIATVPPEEFLISKRARCADSAPYTAHRVKKTISDLISMGFDEKVVKNLPTSDRPLTEDREDVRYNDEEEREDVSIDPMMREVWLLEEYVRCDFNGDGFAELLQVFRVGNKILEHKEVDCTPWATVCPYPVPHKFYGQSDADKIRDLQRINSALWRQTLDNLYLTNNPSVEVPIGAEREDGSTIEALQNPQVGSLIPTRQGGLLTPLAVQFTAGHSYQMLEYVASVREQRSGVTRYNQGMDADTLNKTATGVAKIMEKGQGRTELIARIFAETGVTELFRKILKLIVKYQDRPRTIRLRNRWVEMDPRHWNAEMDVTVNVGLGTGNKDQNLFHLENIFQKQALLHQSGQVPIGYEHVYETVSKMVENMGLPNPERFFPDPTQTPQQQQEQRPDPEILKAQVQAQIEQQKTQASIELERMKAEAQTQIAREKAEAEAQLAREKALFEANLAKERQRFEQEMALERMQFEREMSVQKTAIDTEIKLRKNRPGGDLDK